VSKKKIRKKIDDDDSSSNSNTTSNIKLANRLTAISVSHFSQLASV